MKRCSLLSTNGNRRVVTSVRFLSNLLINNTSLNNRRIELIRLVDRIEKYRGRSHLQSENASNEFWRNNKGSST